MKTIRSNCHEISSYEINKVSLSCFDDKRYILEDGVSSYAYGHYNIAAKICKDPSNPPEAVELEAPLEED